MSKVLYISTLLLLLDSTTADLQQADTKVLEITDPVNVSAEVHNETTHPEIVMAKNNLIRADQTEKLNADNSFSVKIYKFVAEPIVKILRIPKVNEVLRNIGTCIVNGAMELFSYYLPPAFMPLVATAAGFMIPFEPVVMLKQKMPVTSYRRAFNTAMNSFLRTFDQYKVEDEYDPYMTQRFNRRFMNDNAIKKDGT